MDLHSFTVGAVMVSDERITQWNCLMSSDISAERTLQI